MTLQELLQECAAQGKLPKVECCVDIRNATSKIGQIICIRTSEKYGPSVEVQFPGLNYATWFLDTDGTDKRTKYFWQLKIVQP